MLAGKGQSRAGRFGRCQRVHQNPAGLAFDDGHVGNVKTAQLVHPVGHLEQAIVGVQLGVAPQAGIHGVGGLAIEKVVRIKVFEHAAVGGQNLAAGFGNETALGVFKILRVVELQVLGKLGIDLLGFGRGVTCCAAHAAGLAAATGQGDECCCEHDIEFLHVLVSVLF